MTHRVNNQRKEVWTKDSLEPAALNGPEADDTVKNGRPPIFIRRYFYAVSEAMPELARLGGLPAISPGRARRILCYAASALIVLLAVLLQNLLWPQIEPLAFFLFYPAVFLTSWRLGFGPGLFATGLCAVIAWLLFIPPYGEVDFSSSSLLQVSLFSMMGVAFSTVNSKVTSYRENLETE